MSIDLSTVEEGRSDLTLVIRHTETGIELYDIEQDNLHLLPVIGLENLNYSLYGPFVTPLWTELS